MPQSFRTVRASEKMIFRPVWYLAIIGAIFCDGVLLKFRASRCPNHTVCQPRISYVGYYCPDSIAKPMVIAMLAILRIPQIK
jgi:hypothetical protein